jgi:hypothetical protein
MSGQKLSTSMPSPSLLKVSEIYKQFSAATTESTLNIIHNEFPTKLAELDHLLNVIFHNSSQSFHPYFDYY